MSEWVSVEDRLPEGDRTVLVLVWAGHFEIGTWTGEYWYCDRDVERLYRVTHWMPLPEPPHE